jgi:hypothetical protein
LCSQIRTSISRQIRSYHTLGRGRFTEVNLVNWNANNLAEKVFFSQYEELWFNEKMVYETALLRHDNILGNFASYDLVSLRINIKLQFEPKGDKVSCLWNKILLTASNTSFLF